MLKMRGEDGLKKIIQDLMKRIGKKEEKDININTRKKKYLIISSKETKIIELKMETRRKASKYEKIIDEADNTGI